MIKSFPRGVHPPANKSSTAAHNIEIMPAPQRVYIPLTQQTGVPCEAAVKGGDAVVIGQLIGRNQSGVAVFSSVCGTVKTVEERAAADGKCPHVVIENNGKQDNVHLTPLKDDATAQQIVKRVADCGIVGMGGAGFPTATKLNPGVPIEQLLINAAECEPYITCDHRIMLEYTQKFVSGALLMQKALGAHRTIIGVENNKADAVDVLKSYIAQNSLQNITVVPLKPKYPQGSDKQLIYALTGKKIAKGVRSSSYGIAVANVHTALSVYLAVKEGKQSYNRVMTATGGAIKSPKNIWVANGTLFSDIIEFCGGLNQDNPPVKMVAGGAMMGKTLFSADVSTSKTDGCLLLLTKDEAFLGKASQCINCAKCAKVCPMNLMPMFIDGLAQDGQIADTVNYGIKYCVECGSCSYVCPAKRNLVQSIILAKGKLREIEKTSQRRRER